MIPFAVYYQEVFKACPADYWKFEAFDVKKPASPPPPADSTEVPLQQLVRQLLCDADAAGRLDKVVQKHQEPWRAALEEYRQAVLAAEQAGKLDAAVRKALQKWACNAVCHSNADTRLDALLDRLGKELPIRNKSMQVLLEADRQGLIDKLMDSLQVTAELSDEESQAGPAKELVAPGLKLPAPSPSESVLIEDGEASTLGTEEVRMDIGNALAAIFTTNKLEEWSQAAQESVRDEASPTIPDGELLLERARRSLCEADADGRVDAVLRKCKEPWWAILDDYRSALVAAEQSGKLEAATQKALQKWACNSVCESDAELDALLRRRLGHASPLRGAAVAVLLQADSEGVLDKTLAKLKVPGDVPAEAAAEGGPPAVDVPPAPPVRLENDRATPRTQPTEAISVAAGLSEQDNAAVIGFLKKELTSIPGPMMPEPSPSQSVFIEDGDTSLASEQVRTDVGNALAAIFTTGKLEEWSQARQESVVDSLSPKLPETTAAAAASPEVGAAAETAAVAKAAAAQESVQDQSSAKVQDAAPDSLSLRDCVEMSFDFVPFATYYQEVFLACPAAYWRYDAFVVKEPAEKAAPAVPAAPQTKPATMVPFATYYQTAFLSCPAGYWKYDAFEVQTPKQKATQPQMKEPPTETKEPELEIAPGVQGPFHLAPSVGSWLAARPKGADILSKAPAATDVPVTAAVEPAVSGEKRPTRATPFRLAASVGTWLARRPAHASIASPAVEEQAAFGRQTTLLAPPVGFEDHATPRTAAATEAISVASATEQENVAVISLLKKELTSLAGAHPAPSPSLSAVLLRDDDASTQGTEEGIRREIGNALANIFTTDKLEGMLQNLREGSAAASAAGAAEQGQAAVARAGHEAAKPEAAASPFEQGPAAAARPVQLVPFAEYYVSNRAFFSSAQGDSKAPAQVQAVVSAVQPAAAPEAVAEQPEAVDFAVTPSVGTWLQRPPPKTRLTTMVMRAPEPRREESPLATEETLKKPAQPKLSESVQEAAQQEEAGTATAAPGYQGPFHLAPSVGSWLAARSKREIKRPEVRSQPPEEILQETISHEPPPKQLEAPLVASRPFRLVPSVGTWLAAAGTRKLTEPPAEIAFAAAMKGQLTAAVADSVPAPEVVETTADASAETATKQAPVAADSTPRGFMQLPSVGTWLAPVAKPTPLTSTTGKEQVALAPQYDEEAEMMRRGFRDALETEAIRRDCCHALVETFAGKGDAIVQLLKAKKRATRSCSCLRLRKAETHQRMRRTRKQRL
eukprot:TRINITY_DN1846_c0_g1_i3.p1 TRINITY_DN1846_c0_g1~~TRINITY_DN1846_c0_g1_i3.p1  ORF type:complete len:1261 (+),score=315.99 TRINITY_DN1846_c0_g1_i3:2265-6047(+)